MKNCLNFNYEFFEKLNFKREQKFRNYHKYEKTSLIQDSRTRRTRKQTRTCARRHSDLIRTRITISETGTKSREPIPILRQHGYFTKSQKAVFEVSYG